MENIKARFHLPDFTLHFKLNLVMINMLKNCPEYFRDNMEFASVYGAFPPSMWNGGRPQGGFVCAPDYIEGVVNTLNSMGIPLRFTFTNPMIKEEHLSDEYCNTVMKIANNGLNEVIVNSPVLEEYIRSEYPKYKLTSSTCKRITDPVKLAQELEKDYHIVVLDYDLNNKFDILEKMPNRNKLEILVNSCCFPNCKKRVAEYENVGTQQILYNKHLKEHPDEPFRMSDYSEITMSKDFNCPAMRRTPFEVRSLPHHVSPDMIWNEYLPRGINQFKVSGRGTGKLSVIESYMYYFIKPECRNEAQFMFLHNLERNGVVRIDNV